VLRIVAVVILFASAGVARAQHGFVPVTNETAVSGLEFEGNATFNDRLLGGEVVTESPGWLTPIMFWQNHDFTFRPVELQRDVRRLEKFYHRQGFLDVKVDYRSRLDSLANTIDISFRVEEGEPLVLQSVDYVGPDGRQAAHSILSSQRSDWTRTRRDNTRWRIGERPAIPELTRVQAETNSWMRDNGYAFSSVHLAMNVDTTMRLMDVVFSVTPGPVTRVGRIQIDWLDEEPLFDDHIVLRQLPFVTGDLFSQKELTRGQRGLFGLNVFRFALIDMPEQAADTTVDLRVRLQRGDLNVFRAETGYGLEEGVELSGEYTRRNFLGAARRFTLSGILNTPIGQQTNDSAPSKRRRLAASVFQPYFFVRSLSGLVSVFYDRIVDRTTQEEEFGGATDFLYEFKPYRTLTNGISISHVQPLSFESEQNPDPFVRGVFSSVAVFGSTDDHLAPKEGFLIRPSFETGTPLLFSEVEYIKVGLSGTIYKQIGRIGGFAVRLFRGRLWPLGGVSDEEAVESERFDRTRYYAGGADDVRGWAPQLLGPKEAVVVEQDTLWDPGGTLDKWLGNISYRFPLAFTPPEIQWAIFVDGAKLSTDELRIGTGMGVRYQTPVGFIRLDLAYKINPSPEDLRDAHDVVAAGGIENVPEDNGRRFRVHFGIGQAF
jgi:outer membrane protein insertion porin family